MTTRWRAVLFKCHMRGCVAECHSTASMALRGAGAPLTAGAQHPTVPVLLRILHEVAKNCYYYSVRG